MSEARPSMRTVCGASSFFASCRWMMKTRERIWRASEQFHGKWLTMGDGMERAREANYKTENKIVENSPPLMRRLCRRVRVVQLHQRAQKCTSTKKRARSTVEPALGQVCRRWEKYGTRELNKKGLLLLKYNQRCNSVLLASFIMRKTLSRSRHLFTTFSRLFSP